MKVRNMIATVMVFTLPMGLQAAGDVAEGKAKAAMCTSCHGANGKASMPTYPNLAGQNSQYLELAIKAYKSGGRSGGQAGMMTGMAAGLSDADIANLAAYFSSL